MSKIDTQTFKTYANLIVLTIKESDETTGGVAEEYANAVVSEKEGTMSAEEVQAIMDRFPKAADCSNDVVTLVASLFQLAAAYLIG